MTRDELLLLIATKSYGRCPAHNRILELAVSKQCPLMSKAASYLGIDAHIPFVCYEYHKHTCPWEQDVLDACLSC